MIQDLSNCEYFDHPCISDYRASLTFSLTSFCWLWWHFEMNSGIATLTSKSNQSNQYEMNMAKVAAAVGRTSFPIHFYSNFWEGNDVWDQATSDRTFECLSTSLQQSIHFDFICHYYLERTKLYTYPNELFFGLYILECSIEKRNRFLLNLAFYFFTRFPGMQFFIAHSSRYSHILEPLRFPFNSAQNPKKVRKREPQKMSSSSSAHFSYQLPLTNC